MDAPREPDTADKQSRIRSYLQERYPAGYTIEAGLDTKLTRLLFRVRDRNGRRVSLVALSEEFVDDYWGAIEQELDSRDVIRTMTNAGGAKQVIVTRFEVLVEDLTEEGRSRQQY
jgi:hypothetical protein